MKNIKPEQWLCPMLKKMIDIMKYTTLIFFLALFQVSATSYSQVTRLNLRFQNETLVSVFEKIEANSEFSIFYKNELIKNSRVINGRFRDALIFEVLDEVLEAENLTYTVKDKLIIIVPKEFPGIEEPGLPQQPNTVSGKITDTTGAPLPGVTVVVRGTTIGTISDTNGNYVVSQVPLNATLVFSFVGMETQSVPVGTSTRLDIVMNDAAVGIGEVVVTALGISKEARKIGYAISTIDGKDITSIAAVSPVDGLAGKISGVQIDNSAGGTFGASRINIRGVSTFSNNNQPIFIIDGVVIENGVSSYGSWGNDLKNLNTEDFESISILKGAAATALYGSRAINGVVLIETKKGKEGRGLGVNIRHNTAFRSAKGPEWQDVFGGGPWAQGAPWAGKTDPFNTNEFVKNANGEPITATGMNASSWGPKMEGQQIRDYDGEWTSYEPRPKNFEESFDIGLNSNTSVDLSGGTNKLTYYSSFTYLNEKGVYIRNNMEKISVNTRVTYKLTDWLSTDVAFNYVNSDLLNPPTHGIVYGWGYDSFTRSYNTSKWRHQYKAPHGGMPNVSLGDTPTAPSAAAWFDRYENNYSRNEQNLRGVYKINATITKNLSATVEGNFYNRYYFNENKIMGTGYANAGGTYGLEQMRILQNNYKGLLNYLNSWGEFDLNAALGAETFNTINAMTYAQTSGGLVVPKNFNLSNSMQTLNSGGRVGGEKMINSVYSFVSMGYKNRFYLDITARNDWSSALTYVDGSGNNSYLYPSVSGSWVFSESFTMPEWFSFGKLRASWANVGNDTDPYRINSSYSRVGTIKGFSGDIPMYHAAAAITDPNLKPERKNSYEVGTEISLFMDRINLDVAYYNERNNNQIINFPVPSMSGVTSLLINGGEIENQGYEIELKTTPVKAANIEWNVGIMASHNKTTIKSLFPGMTRITLAGQPDYIYAEGLVATLNGSYGDIRTERAYKPFQALDASGNPVSHPNNGQRVLIWNGGDRSVYYSQSPGQSRIVGNIQPKLLGNLSTDLTLFKSLRLSALFDYRIGGHIFHHGMMYMTRLGNLKSSLANRSAEYGGITYQNKVTGKTYDDGIIVDGVFENGTVIDGVNVGGMTHQEAYAKGLVEPSHVSAFKRYLGAWGAGITEEFVVENTYLHVRELTLSYLLPKSITQKLYAQNLVIGVFGRNLGYLYSPVPDKMNLDLNSNGTLEYMAPGVTPKIRTYGFNLSVTF
jgi:iron complex outermembrane recepter protein